MTNILVVTYSRSGTTFRVGHELAGQLGANLETIEEITDRRGATGFVISALESLAKGLPAIRTTQEPSHYDLVVVGTPVWAGNMASPVRAYLTAQRARLPQLAFFATMRGSGAEHALREMKFLCRADAAPSCSFTEAEVGKVHHVHKLMAFADSVKQLALRGSAASRPAADASTWVGDVEAAGQLQPAAR